MPRQIFNIDRFQQGLVTAVDLGDLDSGVSTDGTINLDPDGKEGQLLGRWEDAYGTGVGTVSNATNIAVRLSKDNNSSDLVHVTSGTAYYNVDFGAASSLGAVAGTVSGGGCAVNREARIGGDTPRFVGYISSTMYMFNAELTPLTSAADEPFGNITSTATTVGNMDATRRYFYKLAVEYDGYQESTIIGSSSSHAYTMFTVSSDTAITMNIRIPDAWWSGRQRVTGFNLYRAEAPDASTTVPATLFRFVRKFVMGSGWTVSGGYHAQTYVDLGDSVGQTYEQRTGIAETLTPNFVNYKLCADVNSDLVVARCTRSPELDDATHFIFKSKTSRPDMFNWAEDFLKMPTIPSCLIGFNGRLFAFDRDTTYRINTDGMYIEDQVKGVGACGARSALVTDFGMFIADKSNLYIHNGAQLQPIGTPVVNKWRSWVQSTANFDPIVAYHQRTGCVLFIHPYCVAPDGGNEGRALAYNIAKKRWDEWMLYHSLGAAVTDHNGQLYITSN